MRLHLILLKSDITLKKESIVSFFRRRLKMAKRIINFICAHSRADADAVRELMMRPDQIATDVGSVVYGREAVEVGLVDQLGSVGDALAYLHAEIDKLKSET